VDRGADAREGHRFDGGGAFKRLENGAGLERVGAGPAGFALGIDQPERVLICRLDRLATAVIMSELQLEQGGILRDDLCRYRLVGHLARRLVAHEHGVPRRDLLDRDQASRGPNQCAGREAAARRAQSATEEEHEKPQQDCYPGTWQNRRAELTPTTPKIDLATPCLAEMLLESPR